MKKNTISKVAAVIALIAIISSVIWTWVLVIFETYVSWNKTDDTPNQEQLQELLKKYSGSGELNNEEWKIQIDEGSWKVLEINSQPETTLSWNTVEIETLSWTTN